MAQAHPEDGYIVHPDSWAAHLDPDETLVWTGLPITGFRFYTNGWWFSLMLVSQLAIGLFVVSMISMAAMWVFTLPLPMIVMVYCGPGLAVLAIMGLWRWFKRRTARYALTNKRAIVALQFPAKRLLSYPIYRDKPMMIGATSPKSLYFAHTRHQWKYVSYRSFHGFDHLADFDTALKHAKTIQSTAPFRPVGFHQRAFSWPWKSNSTNAA